MNLSTFSAVLILLPNLIFGQHIEIAKDADPLIIGGSSAPLGIAPYQVSLRRPSMSHMCGGSIIDDRWILTAAHCIIDNDPFVYAIAGSNQLNSGGTTYSIAIRVRHIFYNPSTVENDIGLAKTTATIQFTTYIQPIPLPGGDPNVGDRLTLTGWGRTDPNTNSLPNNLQVTYDTVISNDDCLNRMPVNLKPYIYATSLCTFTAGTGSCKGDSGGPLVSGGSLQGIVSWGVNLCDVNYPHVNTRVNAYGFWIWLVKILKFWA